MRRLAPERRPPGSEACSRAPLLRCRGSEGRNRVRFARGPTNTRSHRDREPRYPGSEGRKRVRFARGPTSERSHRDREPSSPGSEGRKRVRFARGPTGERSHPDREPRYPGSEERKRVRFARGPPSERAIAIASLATRGAKEERSWVLDNTSLTLSMDSSASLADRRATEGIAKAPERMAFLLQEGP